MTQKCISQNIARSFVYGSNMAFIPNRDNTYSKNILKQSSSKAIATDVQLVLADLANSLSKFRNENGQISQS